MKTTVLHAVFRADPQVIVRIIQLIKNESCLDTLAEGLGQEEQGKDLNSTLAGHYQHRQKQNLPHFQSLRQYLLGAVVLFWFVFFWLALLWSAALSCQDSWLSGQKNLNQVQVQIFEVSNIVEHMMTGVNQSTE